SPVSPGIPSPRCASMAGYFNVRGRWLATNQLDAKHGRTRFARSTVLRVDRIIGVGTFDAAVAHGAILVDRLSAEIAADGALHARAPSVAAARDNRSPVG